MHPTDLLSAPDGTRVTITRAGCEPRSYITAPEAFPGQRSFGRRTLIGSHWYSGAPVTAEYDYGPAQPNANPANYPDGYLGQLAHAGDWYRDVATMVLG